MGYREFALWLTVIALTGAFTTVVARCEESNTGKLVACLIAPVVAVWIGVAAFAISAGLFAVGVRP